MNLKAAVEIDMIAAFPHPWPFSRREKGRKPLSLRERGWGEGKRRWHWIAAHWEA
jgi:hypothetical protein